ncbi:hypothetical protein KIPB_005053 [Kipferlia bialata]|uniref:Uncharacterized protein n=1 Tax=Kipferlia bialata TaxID=797122 RepID=A0A9K3GI89_9EUKA|nr:hypothetical protein KIPB_005053 [Kipferlia bialata]|eukprot:g5053.t1
MSDSTPTTTVQVLQRESACPNRYIEYITGPDCEVDPIRDWWGDGDEALLEKLCKELSLSDIDLDSMARRSLTRLCHDKLHSVCAECNTTFYKLIAACNLALTKCWGDRHITLTRQQIDTVNRVINHTGLDSRDLVFLAEKTNYLEPEELADIKIDLDIMEAVFPDPFGTINRLCGL